MINPNHYTAIAINAEGNKVDIMNRPADEVASHLGCSPARIKEIRKGTIKLQDKLEGPVLYYSIKVKGGTIIVHHNEFDYEAEVRWPHGEYVMQSITHTQHVVWAA